MENNVVNICENNKTNGIVKKRINDNNGNMCFSSEISYVDGLMDGLYEIKKYSNNILNYTEKITYTKNIINGYKEIKQLAGKEILYYMFCEYTNGKKNGYFKVICNEYTKEGFYNEDKLTDILTIFYKNKNEIYKKIMYLYENDKIIDTLDGYIIINDIKKTLKFTNDIKIVWRIGTSEKNYVFVKCEIDELVIKNKIIDNKNFFTVNRFKIIEIKNSTDVIFQNYMSIMNTDYGTTYEKNDIVNNNDAIYEVYIDLSILKYSYFV
jgi:hypothetical protein